MWDTRITWSMASVYFSVIGAVHAGGGFLMLAGLPTWTSKSPVSPAVAGPWQVAPVPDLTMTNPSRELQSTMPGSAARLGRFLHAASTNQLMARRSRDQR
jgi:hypothetical protein